MRPGEKEVLKASMLHFAESEVRNQTGVLKQYLYMRHPLYQKRNPSLTDTKGFRDIIRTQVLAVRRAKLLLEAVKLWDTMRRNCLVVSAPKYGGIARYEQAFDNVPPAVKQQLLDGNWDEQNDPRWKEITDDTTVMWDNNDDKPEEPCRWGDLMLADRKTVVMRPDGTLHGGYPF